MTPGAVDLISKLLTINPAARLGSIKRGSSEVREHPFFAPLNFVKLLRRELPTPHVPQIQGALDTSNYDHYDEPDLTEWDGYNVDDANTFRQF